MAATFSLSLSLSSKLSRSGKMQSKQKNAKQARINKRKPGDWERNRVRTQTESKLKILEKLSEKEIQTREEFKQEI